MTAALGLAALAVTAAAGALLSFRAAFCNFRCWRENRHRPYIIATEDQLRSARDDGGLWPWPARQFPAPGVQRAWSLSPLQCRAYANLARRKADDAASGDVIFTLIGAGIVGWLITVIVGTWSAASAADQLTGRDPMLRLVGLGVAVALVAVASVVPRVRRDSYTNIEADYLHALEVQEAEIRAAEENAASSGAGTDQRPPLPEWKWRIMAALGVLLGASERPPS